jgi:glycosyltransferase involved in cell wall biosynthesis
LVARDSTYKFNTPIAIYAFSMETLKTLRFFLIENALKSNSCVIHIVNCSRYPRTFLKRLSKAPLVLHFYMPNLRSKLMTRVLAKKADLIISSSHTLSRYLQETGLDKEKLEVVYPPIDTEFYRPLGKEWARSKLGLSMEDKLVVYIGGLKHTRFPEKIMLEMMTKLVKEIPEAMLLVFTSKDNENIRRAREISMKVKRAGLKQCISIGIQDLTDTEKNIVYNAADVFLFPRFAAKTAIEPPLTVLEAMACAAPVVTPKIPSLSEIIADNENGFLFEPKNHYDLANKLTNVAADTNLRTKVSRHARETIIQKASLPIIGARMIELQRKLTRLSGPSYA